MIHTMCGVIGSDAFSHTIDTVLAKARGGGEDRWVPFYVTGHELLRRENDDS